MASCIVKQSCAAARQLNCTGMRTLLSLAVCAGLLAQTKPSEQDLPATIKVDVDIVNVLASVRDKRGGLIGNLEKGDFTILEDGKPQPIKYFTRNRRPSHHRPS